MPGWPSVRNMKTILLLTIILLYALAGFGQSSAKDQPSPKAGSAEQELKEFYDAYADDLIKGRGEAIANRYDPRGYYSLGNGNKQYFTAAEAKTRYMTRWTAPKGFVWKDMNFEVLSPESAPVVGLFDLEGATGDKLGMSYSAVLVRSAGKWRIRIEDESFNSMGLKTKTISGNRNTAGPYKYLLTAEP